MKRILVIDDEDRIRDLYVRVFEALGSDKYEVYIAPDAWEATSLLLRKEYNLILLDLKMPRVNGKEMFEIIEEYNPRIRVIISSVYSEDKQKQMVPFAYDYFDKSQGAFVLLEKVTRALSDDEEPPKP